MKTDFLTQRCTGSGCRLGRQQKCGNGWHEAQGLIPLIIEVHSTGTTMLPMTFPVKNRFDFQLGIDLAHGRVVAAFQFAGQQHFIFGAAIHLGGVSADDSINHRVRSWRR